MRRGLASLITGLSLLVATVAWAGFTLSRTMFDPGRSERLAVQLLDNPQVEDALIDRLADAVEPQLPPEAPVSRSLIEAGAETALDDPRVRALILDGVVRFHRNALEGNTEPVVIDAGALGLSSRDALVAARPELDRHLPAAPSVQLELPTTGFVWLARVKRFVDRWTVIAALAALAGATVALVVARDRGAVLRRVAFWGYGAAAFWVIVGLGLPRLADVVSPPSGAIASAAIDVFFGAMIRPAIGLAVASTVLLLAGFALPAVASRQGARTLQPNRVGPRGHAPGPAAGATVAATVPTTSRPPTRDPAAAPVPRPGAAVTAPPLITTHPAAPDPVPATVPGPDRTAVFPRPATAPSTETLPGPAGSQPDEQVTQAWEEGVGYLDHSDPDPSGP